MLQRAARNAYSWWWASHIRTKQSKWLDENLQDMEEKVEYILKIIEEDGDSFRERAEMYYRKRPELVNFVEDSFRGYRALAERYDHLSKELQAANRTIASVYPERAHLDMDDEGEKYCSQDSASDDQSRLNKNMPVAPKLTIPKKPRFSRNAAKGPSRLMSRKGLLKMNVSDGSADIARSGLSKSDALQEIDRLQKGILALQTEKEFVQSSYESRQAKYWEIENQVTEMQAKVIRLQDEFGIGTYIEDDEARTLMTATALKSCQETLARLLEQQKQSAEEIRVENRRVQQVRDRFEVLKEVFDSSPTPQPKDLEENQLPDPNSEFKNLEEGSSDAEVLRARIKEELQSSLGDSLTVSELAEKVDELVDKVIMLENEISSQNSYVKRLKSETNDLQKHLESLEVEKESFAENSDIKNKKIRELEDELQRVQSLRQSVEEQSNNLQNRFTDASSNLDDLSEKLQNVKPDEEMESTDLLGEMTQALVMKPLKHFRGDKDVKSPQVIAETGKDTDVREMEEAATGEMASCIIKDMKSSEKTTLSNQPTDLSQNRQESATSSNTAGAELADEMTMSAKSKPTGSSEVSKDAKEGVFEDKRGVEHVHDMGSDLRALDFDHQGGSALGAKAGNFGRETGELASPGNSAKKGIGIEEDERKHDGHSIRASARDEDEELFLSNKNGNEVEYSMARRATEDGTLKEEVSDNDNINLLLETARLSEQGNKGEIFVQPDLHNWYSFEEDTAAVASNRIPEQLQRYNPFQDMYQEKHVAATGRGNVSESQETIMALHKVSDFSGDTDSEKLCKEGKFGGRSKQYERYNPFVDVFGSFKQPDVASAGRYTAQEEEPSTGHGEDQGNIPETARRDLYQKVYGDPYLEQAEFSMEEDDQPNWKDLFLNGLDDRDKILLKEYTATLRNFKEVKRKLNETEKKKRASLFQYAIQIKLLRSANAVKDAEIQSLQKKLSCVQTDLNKTPDSPESQLKASTPVSSVQSPDHDQRATPNFMENFEAEAITDGSSAQDHGKITYVEEEEGDIKIMNLDEPPTFSTIEEKIRMDLDDLLEENIEFWLRFSTSFHQIQKFQDSIHDLQAELEKAKGNKREDLQTKIPLQLSEIRPLYRHFREIQTELSLWLDHNAVLKDDLQNRLSSLSSIQEEITRLSNVGSDELSDYQAAKFQGEVMNMKQENNKIADELQAGVERVRNLQFAIRRTLAILDEELGISMKKPARIPLRSFLFGVKLKKQRHSIFSCVTPSLSKQSSEVNLGPT